MRERLTQAHVTRRGKVRLEKPERHDDSPRDLVGGRPACHLLDEQTGDDVVGVRVLHGGARRELGGPRQRHVEELIGGYRFGWRRGVVVEVLGQAALMAQQLTHCDRVGVDVLAVDAPRQIRLDGCVEVDLALGGELQNGRRDKGFRDAGDADVGMRGEPFAGVDVGVAGRGAGKACAVPDDRDGAGQVVVDHGTAQCGVDGGGLGVGGRGREAEDQQSRADECGAHYRERSSQE